MLWKKKRKQCEKCGRVHDELPAIGFDAPFYYHELSKEEKSEMAELSEDFCVITHPEQTDRFIRVVLKIPLIDACEEFYYGIWVSVSEKTFNECKDSFSKAPEPKTYFGMISNELNDYEESTLGLQVNVETQKDGFRPEIIPHETEHPLVLDWKTGITLKEAERRLKKCSETNR